MKNVLLLVIFILIAIVSSAQSREAKKHYRLGTNALQQQDYDEAIRMLTLSINEGDYPNAYYNRAMAYFNIGDSCSFCLDLMRAYNLGDGEAGNLYRSNCIYSEISDQLNDSIRASNTDAAYLQIIRHKCLPDSIIYVLSKNDMLIDTDQEKEVQDIDEETEEVYAIVEEMPEFPGGTNALNQYIGRSLNYPKTARVNKISGTVFLSFVVQSNGNISNIKVIKGVHLSLDNEAIRLFKSMPQWIPGKQNGIPVCVRLNMPVRFNLD